MCQLRKPSGGTLEEGDRSLEHSPAQEGTGGGGQPPLSIALQKLLKGDQLFTPFPPALLALALGNSEAPSSQPSLSLLLSSAAGS